MKKMLSILLAVVIVALIFTGCYFSVGLFPKIGETAWEYKVYTGTTVYASGTFTVDKRTNFEDLKGTFTQVTPVATVYSYTGAIDKNGRITIAKISLSATEAIRFDGRLNDKENLITGYQEHTVDQTAVPISWLQADWIATKTTK